EHFPDNSPGDLLSIRIEGSLIEDSSLISGNISVNFEGSAEELFRSMLSSVEPSERDLLIERLFGLLPDSEVMIEGDPSSIASPLRLHGTGKWNCGLQRTGNAVYLLLPGLEALDIVTSRAAAYILPRFREDIHIETPYSAFLSITLTDIPSGHPFLPDPLDTDTYSISISCADGALLLEESFSLQSCLPDALQLLEMRGGLLARLSSSARTVVFR
ncbi:MAG: hypothetical protein ABFR50_08430, partial [Candidatus Fermentibacteria bacterium]